MTAHPKPMAASIASRVQFHLNGRSVQLDRRIHAVRGDLADFALAGVLFAPHYARAEAMHVDASGAFVREKASSISTAVSQLLQGETFHLLDVTGDWAWGFCGHDGYVGYVERSALGTGALVATHQIAAIVAPVFAQPDIKSPVRSTLPCAAQVAGEVDGDFLSTADGFLHMRHVTPVGRFETDWVSVAERYLGQPYVWGGRGLGGLDCSGLVQIALGLCGRKVPRDTDLQRDGIGEPISEGTPLMRGDLIFFPGHVGFMIDDALLLHANAHHMTTVIEPLADVVQRLAPTHDQPIVARRRIKV
ncbi:MAG: NlpC/P60 family protein [Sphingobium sp.]